MAAAAQTPVQGSAIASNEYWDSVSYLESAFHHGFMKMRLKNAEFVYHENARLMQELDEFCDVDTMHATKGPVILLGDSGVGKSAFLANWLARRKKMVQNWQSSYPEFIFTHVVGCSRQSCSVSNLLERVLREMKDYFELSKEVPEVEERLSWQFPKFLEAAAKKGRVILVVDGLQRLRTNDGESILKWVPLSFPPNVRIIFTGTVNYPPSKFAKTEESPIGDHYEKTSLSTQMIERIKLEASRRSWKLVHVTPLTEDDRKRIIKKFAYKNRAPSAPRSKSKGSSSNVSGSAVNDSDATTGSKPGLQLFEIQQKAIVSVPMSANAHFLKVFLMSMLWAVQEGFNIHAVFESWLNSNSVGQLLESILRSMETGYMPTKEAAADARQFLAETMKSTATTSEVKRANAPSVSRLSRDGSGSPSKRTSPLSPPSSDLMHRSSLDRSSNMSFTNGSAQSLTSLARRSVRNGTDSNEAVIKFKSNDEYRPNIAMARAKSIHETQEVFVEANHKLQRLRVNHLRGSGSSTDLTLEGDVKALFESARSHLESTGGGSIINTPASSGPLSPASRAQTPNLLLTSSRSLPQLTGVVNASDALPPYLTGGKYVPPLGPLLGKALGLLYVSRHGMLVNELRFILGAMMTEARGLRQQQQHDCLRSGYDSVMERSGNGALLAFSDTEWKALLRAIKSIGVLFVQDVIVLPMCKEILRDVIWWRYIGSERVEQSYHQWLIRFFRIHPTTFRRVEELPWHLQRCYEWDALRAVLVNLPMFQLLYTVNYKRELYGYWKKLSQGPLLNYAAGAESPLDPPVYVAPYDVVKEYGKSLEEWYKSARPPTKTFLPMVQLVTKFMYDFCVYFQGFLPMFQHAPFDLKRLYQDGFTFAEDLPHVHMLSGANALAAAAVAASSSSPVNGTASQSATALGGSMTPSVSAAVALTAALDAFATLGRSTTATNSLTASAAALASSSTALVKHKPIVPNYFFYYQRWIWIQFPWLALSKEIVVRDPVVSNPKASSSSSSFGLGSVGSWGGITTSTGNLQHSLSDAMMNTSHEPIDVAASGDNGSNNSSEDRKALDGGVGGAADASNNAAGGSQARSGLFDARFWDVKKSMFDPGTQKIKGTMSAAQLAAVQKASVKMSPAPTPTTQTLDIISPENLFHKKSTCAVVKNVLGSSARALPTAILNVSASTPALPAARPASPSSTTAAVQPLAVLDLSSPAAVKTFLTESHAGGTASTSPSRQGRARSPSKVDFQAPTTLMLGESVGNHTSNNNNNSSSGILNLNSSALIPTTKDVDAGMFTTNASNNAPSASAAFGLPAHFQDYPQSEWDLKKSYNHRVVLKLQTLHDSLHAEAQRRKAHLESVKAKIKETAKRYDAAMRDCEMAKQATEEMVARAQKLEQMMKSIDHQEKTRRKLVRGCELFPAYDPSHYENCKKELKLLQLTLRDLEEEKRVLLAKKTHLLSVELPAVRAAVDKNRELLHAVVEKLERARDKAAHEQASTDTLFQRRLEMIENVRSGAGKTGDEKESTREQSEPSVAADDLSRRTGSAPRTGKSLTRGDVSSANSSAASGSGSTRSLAVKIALQRCEFMCDKVQKATGFSRMEAVYQKFARREELNASFDEQAKINEARLKQMKLTQSELEQQLHSLEVSNAVASMEDPRSLEQKLRDAEVELAHTEYTQTSLLTTSKEVIAGAARVVKLLGITSCSSPLKNAIPAANLWPPPGGYEGESDLMSEFETLGTAAIGNLLQICLDRAALMIDTIEGARGDPDAMFSQNVVEAVGRGRRRSSKMEDRPLMGGRQGKSGRRATNAVAAATLLANAVADRKDRGFDHGAIRTLALPSAGLANGAAVPTTMAPEATTALASAKDAQARPPLAPPETPEAEEDEGEAPLRELPSRESIKAASRSKLAQRARRDKSERALHHAAHHVALDVEPDGSN